MLLYSMMITYNYNLYLVLTSVLEMLVRTLVKMTLEVQCSCRRMEGETKSILITDMVRDSVRSVRSSFVTLHFKRM